MGKLQAKPGFLRVLREMRANMDISHHLRFREGADMNRKRFKELLENPFYKNLFEATLLEISGELDMMLRSRSKLLMLQMVTGEKNARRRKKVYDGMGNLLRREEVLEEVVPSSDLLIRLASGSDNTGIVEVPNIEFLES
jgi:hypothetical protein